MVIFPSAALPGRFNNHTANVGPVELKELQVLASQILTITVSYKSECFGPFGAKEEESVPDI
jgi:hypothetical protein